MTAKYPDFFGNVDVADVASSRLPSALVLSSSDADTQATRSRWLEAQAHNKQMCAALYGSTVTRQTPPDPSTGRVRVRQVRMGDGRLLNVDGRPTSPERAPSPARIGLYIGACRCAYLVGYDASGDRFSANPVTCRSNLCSWCAGRKASSKVRQWLQLFMALYEDGHQIVHLTLTQPTREGDPDSEPVHLTAFEQRTMAYAGAVAAIDEVAVSTPGEDIASSIDRLMQGFKMLRRGTRPMARAWESSIAGGLYSVEATGKTTRDGTSILRWHTHIHAVLVLPPGTATRFVDDGGRAVVSRSDPWLSGLIERWCSITGASPGGQHCELVSAGERVRGALTEVLKYPTKTAILTDAQKHDWAVSTKGRRMHAQPFGLLIKGSRARTVVRWLASEDEDGPRRSTPGQRARVLLSGGAGVPADVHRVYLHLVSGCDDASGLLKVLVSYARHLMSPQTEGSSTSTKPVYVASDLTHPASKVVPGLGPAVLLTRRMVCESVVRGCAVDLAVQNEDGDWRSLDVDAVELLMHIVVASVDSLRLRPDALTHGNKVDATRDDARPSTDKAHPSTRAGPAKQSDKGGLFAGK